MINIAIIDNLTECINDIERLLLSTIKSLEFQSHKYTDEHEFLEDIHQGFRCDIAFLDIMLNNLNGIDIGEMINKLCPRTKIIFVSVNSEFFKDVYNAEHSYFLIKPLEAIRFSKAVKKVIASLQRNYLTFSLKTGQKIIDLNEVLYFESYLRNTKIYFSNGNVSEIPVKLSEIEDKLPKNKFIRTHQSFIVNIEKHINSERLKIYLPCNTVVPVSKRYANDVKEKVSFFLGGIL